MHKANRKTSMALISEITELLRLRNWSQAELGRQLELHESTISLYVSGDRQPVGPTRKMIHQLLEQARAEAKLEKQPA